MEQRSTTETETEGASLRKLQDRRRKITRVAAGVTLVVTIIVIGATVTRRFSRANQLTSAQLREAVVWRAELFARKARGGIPELSWAELWQMARQRRAFGLRDFLDGVTLNGAIVNSYDSDDDHQIASRIFSVRCAPCHGDDGEGGHIAPPLNRPDLRHGSSDLAIYKTVRDGVPGTAMRPLSLSMVQRWQLVGYIRELQLRASGLSATKAPLDIEVSNEHLLSAGSRTEEWLTYSGSFDGHRYTSLNQITPANVAHLRIQWVRQFETTLPTVEATPLVVDGVIFTTEPPSDIIAVDALKANSGEVIWRYTRNVSEDARACCGRVNRGLAILGRRLYLASYDGYLVCIDADSGRQIWETQIANPSQGYSLSLAPLIVNQSVVVGVAGGEYGIRGFLAAYDAETGKNKWRFNTIPGPGEAGHETWSGDSWRTGGGPPWVTGSYDPSLDLIYWGVGNPSPDFSGVDRAGDNLYTESVIALHGSTGKLAWYFQFTPHDEHDWDSAQTPILADIEIRGKRRRVICWANRNGFYYVLDRITGEFLAGTAFAKETWAKGLDSGGRPILTNTGNLPSEEQLISPAAPGATNFQNAAFDELRGLIFVPASDSAEFFTKSRQISYEAGLPFPGSGGHYFGKFTPVVRALDVATGIKKWEYFSPLGNSFSPLQNDSTSYGGLLATGGGLVFGGSGGSAFALDSSTGHEVWRVFLGGDTRAAPISFTVDGRQVVAISAGRALFVFGL